jgi:hypothetical protein
MEKEISDTSKINEQKPVEEIPEIPNDKELCQSMYSVLQDMDMRLKKLEEKLNKPLIG